MTTVLTKGLTSGVRVPPELDVWLSDHRLLTVSWNTDLSCKHLKIYEALDYAEVNGRDATDEETGLEPKVLEQLIDEVHEATMQWWAEQ